MMQSLSPAMQVQGNIQEQLKIALTGTIISFKPEDDWYKNAWLSLQNACPAKFGCTAEEFAAVVALVESSEKSLNCFDFALINNFMEEQSAKSLGMNLATYCRMQVHVEELAVKWNDQTEPIRQDIIQKVVEEQKSKANNLRKQ